MATHTWIRNPDTGGVWACPEGALDMYLGRGWELCDEPLADDSHLYDVQPTATAPPLDKLNKPELVALCEAAGLDASGTKAELIERLTNQ